MAVSGLLTTNMDSDAFSDPISEPEASAKFF